MQEIQKWCTEIDEITAAFQQAFGELSEAQLNWKPNANTWSIAQNIDHLIVINQSYFPVLAELKSGEYKPPFLAKIGFVVNFLGRMILQSVQPNRSKKVNTFPVWEPSKSAISGDILQRFEAHQEKLKKEIRAVQPFIAEKQVISSPANRNIVYQLDVAFDIIITHERRHLNQAKEILSHE